MQTNDTILEAFANGDLIKVLRGEGEYSVGVDQWVSANVPTDWTKVLPIFYEYANTIDINKATSILNRAILSLLSGNAEDIYIGMSVFYLQILIEEDHRSPIAIDRKKLSQVAACRIRSKEHELRITKKWQGQNNPDGLWAEVERYRHLLKLQFGIDTYRVPFSFSIRRPNEGTGITENNQSQHGVIQVGSINIQPHVASRPLVAFYCMAKASPSGKKIPVVKYSGNKPKIEKLTTKSPLTISSTTSNTDNLRKTTEHIRPAARYTRKS